MNKTIHSFFFTAIIASSFINVSYASDSYTVSGTFHISKNNNKSSEKKSSKIFLIGTLATSAIGLGLYSLYRYLDIHTPKQDEKDKKEILEKAMQQNRLLTNHLENKSNDLDKNISQAESFIQMINQNTTNVKSNIANTFNALTQQHNKVVTQQDQTLNKMQHQANTLLLSEKEKQLNGEKFVASLNNAIDMLFEKIIEEQKEENK